MTVTRLLVIEQDKVFSDRMSGVLRGQGYEVTQCFDSQQGLTAALSKNIDLILLDASLPTIEGLSLLQRIRISIPIPIMVLSAENLEQSRIEYYQQGADDFIAKPANMIEILLRVKAVLRRTFEQENKNSSVLDVDQLTLVRAQQQVMFNGDHLEFTPIQFRLLWVLVENRYQVMSKPYLYQAVLDRAFSRYDRSLDMHLSRIRKKLVEMGMAADRLATVHGKGYRFA
ncbi:DNA-binding response regulator [Saccharobesus litoralis]|uniref:DNA-binding response regulator n=1 Tax=Saccharobesus litoralis TaxID=2172099 RepID=A0A2S0VPM0_9ALTE|nr:response regulator transcription factor [Saccharobesus litoralis]AWB66132.1 DNA-binding response regulator [Saccharobesus litoralis]